MAFKTKNLLERKTQIQETSPLRKKMPEDHSSIKKYQRWESNPHTLRYTILSRARLPIPPLWLM